MSRRRLSITPPILSYQTGRAINLRIAPRFSDGLISDPMPCPTVGSHTQACSDVWDSQFCLIAGAFPRHPNLRRPPSIAAQ